MKYETRDGLSREDRDRGLDQLGYTAGRRICRGGMFSPDDEYTVCNRCGAMILLPTDWAGPKPLEMHEEWHACPAS